jgi:hypothetical protein
MLRINDDFTAAGSDKLTPKSDYIKLGFRPGVRGPLIIPSR